MLLKIIFLLLIILMFISSPFVFSEALYLGREIRTFLIITLILLLFLKIRKFRFIDIFIFILIGIFIFLNIFFSESLLNNIFSFFSVILVAFLLFILLRSNKLSYNIFLNFWLYFSFILSIAAIISFLVNQFTNLNFDILNLKTTLFLNSNYDYKVNIFGLTLSKNFHFITVERVCSFFNEPQYAGFFFILNILLIKVNRNLTSKKFLVTQILAGMLTFSLTFYIAFAILLISFFKRYVIYFYAILLYFILLFLIITNSIEVFYDFFYDNTSLQDRLNRSYNFYKTLKYFSAFNIFFGNGINTYKSMEDFDYSGSLSSGYEIILFDFGFLLFGFILIKLILSFLKNPTFTFICMLYLFVFPFFKHYYAWYLIILCSLAYNSKFIFKNTKI